MKNFNWETRTRAVVEKMWSSSPSDTLSPYLSAHLFPRDDVQFISQQFCENPFIVEPKDSRRSLTTKSHSQPPPQTDELESLGVGLRHKYFLKYPQLILICGEGRGIQLLCWQTSISGATVCTLPLDPYTRLTTSTASVTVSCVGQGRPEFPALPSEARCYDFFLGMTRFFRIRISHTSHKYLRIAIVGHSNYIQKSHTAPKV